MSLLCNNQCQRVHVIGYNWPQTIASWTDSKGGRPHHGPWIYLKWHHLWSLAYSTTWRRLGCCRKSQEWEVVIRWVSKSMLGQPLEYVCFCDTMVGENPQFKRWRYSVLKLWNIYIHALLCNDDEINIFSYFPMRPQNVSIFAGLSKAMWILDRAYIM